MRFVFMVSGTVTVLFAGGLTRPAPIEAQGIGTMQVVARVTPAGAAWDGLAAAQKAAREFAVRQTIRKPRRIDHVLSQVDVAPSPSSPSSPSPSLAISIQYLRN
jgi:hypothetical protein